MDQVSGDTEAPRQRRRHALGLLGDLRGASFQPNSAKHPLAAACVPAVCQPGP